MTPPILETEHLLKLVVTDRATPGTTVPSLLLRAWSVRWPWLTLCAPRARCCHRHGRRHDATWPRRTSHLVAIRGPTFCASRGSTRTGCRGHACRFRDCHDLARHGRGRLGERAMVAVLIACCGHTRWNLVFLVVRVSVVHVHTYSCVVCAVCGQARRERGCLSRACRAVVVSASAVASVVAESVTAAVVPLRP